MVSTYLSTIFAIVQLLCIGPSFVSGTAGPITLAPATSDSPKYFQTKDSFVQQCLQQFNGTADGTRCFFSPSTVAQNWTDAWSLCKSHSSKLAQIHTDSEYAKINAYIPCKYVQGPFYGAFFGLRRNNVNTSDNCSISLNVSFWYDDQNSPIAKLSAANTWIRYRNCWDHANQGAYCMYAGNTGIAQEYAYSPSDPVGNMKFADYWCDSPAYALCQYTGASQNYTLTNVCMAETPIVEIPGTKPQDCGDWCSKQSWCRSFNFITTVDCNSQCQMFSWSIYDKCPACPKTNGGESNCFHYTYDP